MLKKVVHTICEFTSLPILTRSLRAFLWVLAFAMYFDLLDPMIPVRCLWTNYTLQINCQELSKQETVRPDQPDHELPVSQ